MQIRVLGAHNCESSDTGLAGLLIDGVLALDAGSLTSSLSFAEQLSLKAVLLTHYHYDHVRDIPAIAMNHFLHESSVSVISTMPVYDFLSAHLLNDDFYPAFLRKPQGRPAIKFTVLEGYETERVGDYSVLAVPVKHAVPGMGYQVTSAGGKSVFYTGDTGPGLSECWEKVSPQLLVIELTAPDRYRESMLRSGHFTPTLLREELEGFRGLKGYLPRVALVHMNPALEKEIEAEVAGVARALSADIFLCREGMSIDIW